MGNISEIIKAQLDAVSLRQLRLIAGVADSHGLQAYLVGGAIRDAMLGLPVGDIDITIVGLTPEFPQYAARALGGKVVSGSQFNTFALSASGRRIDLAMTRHETYAHPGALPTVAPGTMRQDLARRDFTINAMAASISESSFGDLLDPFSGKFDLESSIIRSLHDVSFQDDATRILRAARYAVRLGFTLESETECLIRRDGARLDTISAARVHHEFARVLQESRAVGILELLHRISALRAIHPALTLNEWTLNALRRAEQSLSDDKPALLLSILACEMDAGERKAFIGRLGMGARWAKVVCDTGLAQARAQHDLSVDALSHSEIHTRLRLLDESAILGCALSGGDSLAAQRMKLYLNELRHIKPILNGKDILALGVPQGPRIGELLNDLLTARLDQNLKTREDEMKFVAARL